MTDDDLRKLLREVSRLAPPWEVRQVHPYGWDVRSTRWADENTIVAHCSGHGADGDARLIAAAPALASELLAARDLVRRLASVLNQWTSSRHDWAPHDADRVEIDALLAEARKAAP